MKDDDQSDFISYSKFEKTMLEILSTKECDPDSGDILLQAFRTIDTQNTGYISADLMEELLTTKGAPFRLTKISTPLQHFFRIKYIVLDRRSWKLSCKRRKILPQGIFFTKITLLY